MTGSASPPAILFWVQHLLGVGHFARTAALARSAAAQGYAAHIASGGPRVPGICTGAAILHPLPAFRAADDSFGGPVNERGAPVGEADWQARRDRLASVLRDVRPQLVVLEHFPFGRRAFREEIAGLLARARSPGAIKVAVSLRDILVERKTERWSETAGFVEREVDRVFVHGDPAFVALDETFPPAARIAPKLHYTGYVDLVPGGAEMPANAEPEILVSSGGGGVGSALRTAALALGAGPNGERIRVRVGPAVPARELEDLQASAGPHVVVERNRPDFRARLAACACSVSQAGYNTVVDLLKTGAPSVLVPFDAAGETEQMRRARRLEALERAVVLPEASLTAHRLTAAIAAAQALPRRPVPVRLDGAESFVRGVRDLIGAPA